MLSITRSAIGWLGVEPLRCFVLDTDARTVFGEVDEMSGYE